MGAFQPWKREVQIDLAGKGKYRTLRSTDDAAECLLYSWPRKRGRALKEARLACLYALEGEIPVDQAREAFLAAADEADLYVRKR
jgi:hypothetical protein